MPAPLDLGATLDSALAAWQALDHRARVQARLQSLDAYKAAGWTFCHHDACPPWSCRPDLFGDAIEPGHERTPAGPPERSEQVG